MVGNFKAAMLAFLQLHSPDFMILQKDLKAMPKPPRDRLPRAQVTLIAVAPSSANDAPVLSSIDPIVHPVAGGRMTVTGVNFKPGIGATFVGPTASRAGDVQFLSSSKIVVWGPPLPSAVRGPAHPTSAPLTPCADLQPRGEERGRLERRAQRHHHLQ